MPVYTYECECGEQFEFIQTIAERKTAQCKCGAVAPQIIGAPNVIGFQFGEFEHMADEPVYIRNKEELRSAERRYECYATGFD